MDILSKIIALRGEKGWSEYRLSIESGVPQSTISSWFRKSAQPSLASIEAICRASGITMSAFFAEEGAPRELTAAQEELLDVFSHLSCEQQAALLSFLQTFEHK